MMVSVETISLVQEFLRERNMSTSSPDARELVATELKTDHETLEEVFGNGPLQALLEDPKITEILVNGAKEIWVEREGLLSLEAGGFANEESLRRWVRRVLSERGRKVDHSAPFADCTLADGSRIHVVSPPVSRKGICLSIRKFPAKAWSLEALVEKGGLSPYARAYLLAAVREKKNIFVSGGTGAGKTSLLGALLGLAEPSERIIALEDISEIKVDHPHFLSLEARPANQEGEGALDLGRLLREALRMRPDRLVVGECRGPEALELLLALNTGHAGSMGTIHANSPRDALQRLETLALLASENLSELALKNLITGGVQVIVQLERSHRGRRVSGISELKGVDGGRFLLKEVAL